MDCDTRIRPSTLALSWSAAIWRLLAFLGIANQLFVVLTVPYDTYFTQHPDGAGNYVPDDPNGGSLARRGNESAAIAATNIGTKTLFSDHVLGIIRDLSTVTNSSKKCQVNVHFVVEKPYSPPKVVCDIDDLGKHYFDCGLMKDVIFSRNSNNHRILPHNVSIGFNYPDYDDHPKNQPCLTNASPQAVLCVPNMQDRNEIYLNRHNKTSNYGWDHMQDRKEIYLKRSNKTTNYGWDQPPRDAVPWNQRDPVPVFRGNGWLGSNRRGLHQACSAANFTPSDFVSNVSPEARTRYEAVMYSMRHPDRLNARLSRVKEKLFPDTCKQARQTNPDFAYLVAWSGIEPYDYFSKYQVGLVLRGMGPAFRVNRHFMAGTAVILQHCDLEEWYTSYLVPYEHYIPLEEDLGNLTQVLDWVRDNPVKVKEIADNGFMFYEKYLTFAKTEEHFYELLWRLSMFTHSNGTIATYTAPDMKIE